MLQRVAADGLVRNPCPSRSSARTRSPAPPERHERPVPGVGVGGEAVQQKHGRTVGWTTFLVAEPVTAGDHGSTWAPACTRTEATRRRPPALAALPAARRSGGVGGPAAAATVARSRPRMSRADGSPARFRRLPAITRTARRCHSACRASSASSRCRSASLMGLPSERDPTCAATSHPSPMRTVSSGQLARRVSRRARAVRQYHRDRRIGDPCEVGDVSLGQGIEEVCEPRRRASVLRLGRRPVRRR